ncbi:MAG: LamG domain-containing protein [Candidatus Poribacteria bacterium]|nr:LamG domain-containing protein [Candidatus Poribacteria bacterium]
MRQLRTFLYIVAFGVGLTANALADLADGLVNAWTFDDGKVTDVIGGHDGKLIDGAAVVKGGMFGMALDLKGDGGYASVEDSPDFDYQANAMSVSAWIFVRAGKDHSAIVWKGEKIGWGSLYTFRIATTSNTGLTWGTCNGAENYFATDGAYAAGEWVHVCQTVDGKTAIGYVNAKVPASGQGNPKASAAPYNLFKGKPIEMGVGRAVGGTVGNDAYLDGMIDEIYLWDRALSLEEVQELSAGGRPDAALAVNAASKATTTWGALKTR